MAETADHLKRRGQATVQIRTKVERHQFSVIKNLTVSIGVSEYISGDSLQSIINRSDKAVYEAKLEGRNRVKTL